MIKLFPHPPFAVTDPRLAATGETCIQQLSRLDARVSTSNVPTEDQLHAQEGAPCVCGALPPSVLLALPRLAS
eukprot:5008123-Prymnesium_polylepis.1